MRSKKLKHSKEKENPSSSYWMNKADKIWSIFIKKRDRVCVIGCSPIGYIDPCFGPLESAHLIGRSVKKFRHDLNNGLALCSKHHNHSKVISYHSAMAAFIEWVMEFRPEQYRYWQKRKKRITSERVNFKEKHDQLIKLIEANKVLR